MPTIKALQYFRQLLKSDDRCGIACAAQRAMRKHGCQAHV